jgi:stalled ribosome rescue protein Dom34
MSSSSRYDDIADRLEAISEELGDASIDVLSEAIRAGATTRPVEDKKLAQARRAVEKAANLVRGLGNAGNADLDFDD